MSVRQSFSKLFYDLEKAKTFGLEVDRIASESTVQTGKRTFSSIFMVTDPGFQGMREVVGSFHYVIRNKGANNKDYYYVQYNTYPCERASKADLIQTKQKAVEHLNRKYQEIEPNTGRSLG